MSETIPALVKLREEGLIRHVGFTGLPLAIYKKVLDRYNVLAGRWLSTFLVVSLSSALTCERRC